MSTAIPPLDLAQFDVRLRERLGPDVAKRGYLGDFLRCAAHQPEALLAFEHFSEALGRALPAALTSVVSLTVAALAEDRYARHQLERQAQEAGLSRAWIAAVLALDAGAAAELSAAERAVQNLVIAALEGHGRGVGRELHAVKDELGAEQTVAVLMLIGRYASQAIFVNALQLPPPVPSIFEPPSSVTPGRGEET